MHLLLNLREQFCPDSIEHSSFRVLGTGLGYGFVRAEHCMGLASPCLPIRQESSIEPLEELRDDVLDRLEDFLLRLLTEHLIELEILILALLLGEGYHVLSPLSTQRNTLTQLSSC